MKPLPRLLAALIALSAATGTQAQGESAGASAPPLWELGAFAVDVSQQAYPGSDQQVRRALALPAFVYRGRVLRADRDTAGLRAVRTPRLELDIGFAGSFGARSDDLEARRGMPDLGTLVEFGPRLTWNLAGERGGTRWRLELPLRSVFDLDDGARQRGLAFEPELQFDTAGPGGWRTRTSLSAIVADRRLADTFYGVAPAFVTPARPAFEAEAGLVAWRASASFSRALSRDWRLFGFARLDTVSGAANRASPLVRQTTGGSVGLGIATTWKRSTETARD